MPFTKIQKVKIHRVCNSYAIIGCLPESRMGYKKWCLVFWSTGCPKKTHFQNAAGATVHWLNHHLPAPLVSGDWFFGRFLLRLSRIKRPQVMSIVQFIAIALNFDDFVLLVHFLGHPVLTKLWTSECTGCPKKSVLIEQNHNQNWVLYG